MNGYIIYLPKSNLSRTIASQSKRELDNLKIDLELFVGCDRYDVWNEFISRDLKINDISRFGAGYVDSELGAFVSHYKLWLLCKEKNQNIIVFEHDVELIEDFDIDKLKIFNGDILNLGKPNWGNRVWKGSGIIKRKICTNNHNIYKPEHGECQCNSQWLFGAHSYVITPKGADKLLTSVKRDGILPADLFIRQDVVDIHDLLPHPFIQKKTFSLIQRNPIYENQKVNEWDY